MHIEVEENRGECWKKMLHQENWCTQSLIPNPETANFHMYVINITKPFAVSEMKFYPHCQKKELKLNVEI